MINKKRSGMGIFLFSDLVISMGVLMLVLIVLLFGFISFAEGKAERELCEAHGMTDYPAGDSGFMNPGNTLCVNNKGESFKVICKSSDKLSEMFEYKCKLLGWQE